MANRPIHRLACRRLPLLLLWLAGTGCGASWQAVPLPPPEPLRSRQQVQVWRHGVALRLHGVVLTGDSLSGIPYLQPLTCDSCRVALARSNVDSLRAGDPESGLVAGAVLGVVLVTILLVVGCYGSGEFCGVVEHGGT